MDDDFSDEEGYSRRGVPLEPQTRLCIQNVRDYFMKERDNQGPLISVNKVVERVAAACNVSKHTVSKICKEIADGKYGHKKKAKKVPRCKQDNGEPSNMLSPLDDKLIECVRSREFLYNTKAPGHADRFMKDNAWQEIANEIQSDAESSKRTWDRFRRNYVTIVKKIGIEEIKRMPPWTFEQRISFLLPYLRVSKQKFSELQQQEQLSQHDSQPLQQHQPSLQQPPLQHQPILQQQDSLLQSQPLQEPPVNSFSGLLDLTSVVAHPTVGGQSRKDEDERKRDGVVSSAGVIGYTTHVPTLDSFLY